MDFYNTLVIPALRAAGFVLRLADKKFAEREREWKDKLELLARLPKAKSFRVWFHAASMGEFEQAKPVIEGLKALDPDIQVIVSFFSPSGYRTQKNYPLADAVVYMPLDTRDNAGRFIGTMAPDFAVFIRYELWKNHLEVLREKNIPAVLLCATFGKEDMPLLPLRDFKRSAYSLFDTIYPLNAAELEKFRALQIPAKLKQISDTRFDRIAAKVAQAREKRLLPPQFDFREDFVVVLGSSWGQDEKLFVAAMKRIDREKRFSVRLIIVPHEPSAAHIANAKKEFPDSLLLSEIIADEDVYQRRHIIVDSIGQLLTLYSYADAAYVGGGFGAGIHSLAEPAAYGVPLACGPKTGRSPDAEELLRRGALRVLKNSAELYDWLCQFIAENETRKHAGDAAASYIYDSLGSSGLVANEIMTRLNATKGIQT